MAFESPIDVILAVQTRHIQIHLDEQDPNSMDFLSGRNVLGIEPGEIAPRALEHSRMRVSARKRRPELLRAPTAGAEHGVLFTSMCTPGIAATEAEHNKLEADRASSAPVQSVHRYCPFVVEDRGRLGKSALTVVYIFAVLLAGEMAGVEGAEAPPPAEPAAQEAQQGGEEVASAEDSQVAAGASDSELVPAQAESAAGAAISEEEAATRIQAMQRGVSAREVAALKAQKQQEAEGGTQQPQEEGAEDIAANIEATPVPMEGSALSEEEAAVRIQARQRGISARKEVAAMKSQHQEPDAGGPQNVGEQLAAQKEKTADEPTLGEEEAATRIQAMQRGVLARKEVAAMKAKQHQEPDVGGLQDAAEQPAAQAIANGPTLDEEEAATRIQAVQRGVLARKEVAAMKAEKQRTEHISGHESPQRAVEEEEEDATSLAGPALDEEEAAVRIQAVQRGGSARKKVAAIKAQQQSQPEEQPGEQPEEQPEEQPAEQPTFLTSNESDVKTGEQLPNVDTPKQGSPFEPKPSRIPRGAPPPADPPTHSAAPSPAKAAPKRRQKKQAAAGPMGLPAWNSSPKVRRPLHDPGAPGNEPEEEAAPTPPPAKKAPDVSRQPPRKKKPRPPPEPQSHVEASPPRPKAKQRQQQPPPRQPPRPRGRAVDSSPGPEAQDRGRGGVDKEAAKKTAAPAQPPPPSHETTTMSDRAAGLGGSPERRGSTDVQRVPADFGAPLHSAAAADAVANTTAALRKEQAARAELEDMLLRIERHFKLEQAARKKAEEELEEAREAEAAARAEAAAEGERFRAYAADMDRANAELQANSASLDELRAEYEAQLAGLRQQLAETQQAVVEAEDRGHYANEVDRQRVEAEVAQRLGPLQMELDHTRMELMQRTATMGEELQRWRWQAENSAAAMLDARADVMERKRELDSAKEKMDGLVDKLMYSRERGIELTSAIDQQMHRAAQPPAWMMMGGMGGMRQGAGQVLMLPPPQGAMPPQGGPPPQQASPPKRAGGASPFKKQGPKASPSGYAGPAPGAQGGYHPAAMGMPPPYMQQQGGYYMQQNGGYGSPQQRGGYGGPPQNGGYGGPPQNGGYGGPPQNGGYGGPPPVHLPAIDAHRGSPSKAGAAQRAKPKQPKGKQATGDRWAEAAKDQARLAHAAGRFG
eukprot:jgi/Tetstr1/441179/TSEL_029437.t1